MSIPQIKTLTASLASLDPLDMHANSQVLGMLKDLRTEIRALNNEAALEGLEGAILMLSFHVRTVGLGGDELMNILRRVVQYLQGCMIQHAASSGQMDPSTQLDDLQLGQILIRMGYLNEDEVEYCLDYGRDQGIPFGEALLQNRKLGEEQIREALALQDSGRRGAMAMPARQVETEAYARGGGPRVIKMSPSLEDQKGTELKLMTDVMLGEVLMRSQIISQKDLDDALLCQRMTGARLGEALVQSGACLWNDVETALGMQARLRGNL